MSDEQGRKFTCMELGTPVKVGPASERIEGTITGISIRGHVTYEVSWWSGREYKCAWFLPCELLCEEPARKVAIGFVGGSP